MLSHSMLPCVELPWGDLLTLTPELHSLTLLLLRHKENKVRGGLGVCAADRAQEAAAPVSLLSIRSSHTGLWWEGLGTFSPS